MSPPGATGPTDSAPGGDEPRDVTRPAAAQVPADAAQPIEFKAIYAEQFAFVWRCLRALGVSPPQLDDAAQEVFIAVHHGLPGFRGEAALRTWLYGIVRNVAYKQRRSLARKAGRGEPLSDEQPTSEAAPDERAQDAQAAEFVRAFVAGLDDKKRDIFVLALLEELSIPEVASIVGIPLNTAYTRLRAVRAELRAALEQRGALP